MNVLADKKLTDFFENYHLYSKIELFDTFVTGFKFNFSNYFSKKAYKFYCPNEKDYHTFQIEENWGNSYEIHENNVPDYYLDKERKVNFSFHLSGVCQSCGFKMDFLINMFSQKEIKKDIKFPALYIRKIGQFPAVERNPEKEVLDYLSDEDKDNYRKALSNLSLSYGIGAFAYFRRIIENEIKHIVKDLSELDFDGSEQIKTAWNEYEKSHQMSNLIDNINPYIPKSLKEIGDNPIKLLHSQLSGGIHVYSEETCLEKAKQIDILLRYVIKKVSSEKYELSNVRQAMNKLKE
ncbi:hypothetical protein [Hyunsoonleella pacifica]|uniref:DUF4145 domain-containing protein n=1 Tax=Hyunsoonleella pacifica TaxID=1080224 RepID=A0A4Q9FPX2_9FLAO|nr:hypothetical protein [Hyunsoonleella pacifica]TBN16718.1 hypothetical protein EYD46_08800 [Hyunsoonleella pacifica]GGD17040.1 hypothetical protein GCM10011368_18750 [Hyunsoonleella pacifica]